MAESDVVYTPGQLAAMDAALNRAENSRDPATTLRDLEAYYQAQTKVRGYAELASQVVENTGLGIVANQEVEDAVGKDNYTLSYRANLARLLAGQDYRQIIDNHDFVPTLAEDAEDHLKVFQYLHLPITSWGGTAYTAMGDDFTLGYATKAELRDITPTDFENLTPSQIQDAIDHLFKAGLQSSPELGWRQDFITGPMTLAGLEIQLRDREPFRPLDSLFWLENDIGRDFDFYENAIFDLGKKLIGENAPDDAALAEASPAEAPGADGAGDRGAGAVPHAVRVNKQTVALAAALYKAIHKEPSDYAAGGANAPGRIGPTGHRDDPIFIHPSGGARKTRLLN